MAFSFILLYFAINITNKFITNIILITQLFKKTMTFSKENIWAVISEDLMLSNEKKTERLVATCNPSFKKEFSEVIEDMINVLGFSKNLVNESNLVYVAVKTAIKEYKENPDFQSKFHSQVTELVA